MSAETCQVCGCSELTEYDDLDGGRRSRLECGGSFYLGCKHAERLAIERAAEIERLKAMLAPKWTDRRAFLLTERLAGLLRDCNDLDTSSGIIGRLNRIMANAEQLTTAHPDYCEPSFLEFLNQLCREDRRNQTNQETK